MTCVYDDPTADVALWLDTVDSAQWLESDARQHDLRQGSTGALGGRSLHGTGVVRLEDGTMAATVSEAEPLPSLPGGHAVPQGVPWRSS